MQLSCIFVYLNRKWELGNGFIERGCGYPGSAVVVKRRSVLTPRRPPHPGGTLVWLRNPDPKELHGEASWRSSIGGSWCCPVEGFVRTQPVTLETNEEVAKIIETEVGIECRVTAKGE